MLDKIMSLIPFIKEFLPEIKNSFLSTPFDKRVEMLAYFIAPAVVFLFWASGKHNVHSLITVTEMKSSINSQGQSTKGNSVVIINHESNQNYSLVFEDSVENVWTSLDYETLLANTGNIRINKNTLLVDQGMVGKIRPVVLYISGSLKKKILLQNNKTLTKDQLKLPSKESSLYAFWGFVVSAFSFGLTIASFVYKEQV